MAQIRHLAIKTKDPERQARFYEDVFDLKVIHRAENAVYMSDGWLTLALLPNRGNAAPNGINHFGFVVDDMADIEERLSRFNEPLTGRPANRFAERRTMDLDGNLIDVSVAGYEPAATNQA